MKKIIVATDFSENSHNTIDYASFLAEQFNAELSVVHVYFPVVSSDPNLSYDTVSPVSFYEEMIQIYKSKLDEIVDSLKQKKINAVSELILGSLSSGISSYANEKGADLIVVGKASESSFIDRLLGSNAISIVTSTSVPVLIVPADSHKPVFRNIIYGTELESDEKDVLNKVFEFAGKLHSKVILIKINADFELDIQSDNQILADIQKSLAKEKFSLEAIKADKVSEGLLQAAHTHGADLLVVARHHHNFLSEIINPSKSKEIISRADVPLLVYDLEA